MQFDTVAIVGVGLIGGSIGMAIRKRRLARRVVGVGRQISSLNKARRLGAVDCGTTKLSQGVADAELVFFCTPVDRIVEQAQEAAVHCSPRTVLTDSGSTKARIVSRLERGLPDGVSFIGSHPLAGSERSGVQEARADLFDGRVCVVTQTARTPPAPLHRIEKFWQSLGSRVIRMFPEDHDRALAYTSHLPHLAAAALSVVLPEKYYEVVASGFRDTTRIAASDPDLWTAIFLENKGPLLDALVDYESVLKEFRIALERAGKQRLRALWEESKNRRNSVAEQENQKRIHVTRRRMPRS